MQRAGLWCGLIVLMGCGGSSGGSESDGRQELAYLGGRGGTVFASSSNAFREPLPGLTDEETARHGAGDRIFEAKFVTAPAPVFAGLGPYFNNTSCDGCHAKEGRGRPEVGAGSQGSQLLIMVSLPADGTADAMGPRPVPGVGLQIRDQATYGVTPVATAALAWSDTEERYFADGTPYKLRRPVVTVATTASGPLPAETMTSLRQPLAVFGLGLLEAIPEAVIRARASEVGKISGRVNDVWSRTDGKLVLGRFGRKASVPSIREQAAKAFAFDIGLTNEVFPSDGLTPDAPAPELAAVDLDGAAYYLRTLAVPARRNMNDAVVQRGEALFQSSGCTGCHVQTWQTGPHDIAALSEQTIHPYTDLLLHQMGDELADQRPDFAAAGDEWRTPALWGIGLAETVLPGATYLHDGRARTIAEAVLWHGGQAAGAREVFRSLVAADREAILAFLRSL